MPPRPVRPNAGLRVKYERRLTDAVDTMAKAVERQVASQYRRATPVLAQDASPANDFRTLLRRMSSDWLGRFDDLSTDLGRWFAAQNSAHVDRSTRASARGHAGMMALLRKGGFTVRFKLTPAHRDVLAATVAENVGLIKSIPEQYLKSVEGIVMRGVQVGGDLASITKGLQQAHGVTRRRAVTIAYDQTNKATAAFTRVRQLELGLVTATWLHSAGGRFPRPTHIAHSGKPYSIKDGIVLNPKEGVVWPGTAVRCSCVSQPSIPGFEDD